MLLCLSSLCARASEHGSLHSLSHALKYHLKQTFLFLGDPGSITGSGAMSEMHLILYSQFLEHPASPVITRHPLSTLDFLLHPLPGPSVATGAALTESTLIPPAFAEVISAPRLLFCSTSEGTKA